MPDTSPTEAATPVSAILLILAAGMLMAAPLVVPVVNLFVPVLGAATFTHIFHRLNRAAR